MHATVPQLAVLAYASCFVTHAGASSVTEALCNAVPMVAVPAAGDQFLMADQVAALGIGYLLPAMALSPATLRRAVERVSSDPAVAERLATLRGRLDVAGGAARAADIVERSMTEASGAASASGGGGLERAGVGGADALGAAEQGPAE